MKVACRLSSKIFKLNMINPTTPASWPHQTVCIISIVSLLSNKTNISVSSWQYGHYFICFLFPRLLYLHTPSVLPLIYVYKWYQNTVEKTQVTRDPNPSIIELRLRRNVSFSHLSHFVLVRSCQLFLHYVWCLSLSMYRLCVSSWVQSYCIYKTI